MDFAVIIAVSLAAAALTFVSGFGLGTLLMPAFAFFFPLEVAIAATAVVHGVNNLFRITLVGKHADRAVLARFLPAAIALALLGAWLLTHLGRPATIASYTLPIGEATRNVTWTGLVVGAVMIGFALLELSPRFETLAFERRWLPLGGAISGFFGGLTGHQGALRTAFLVRCGLSKDQLLGTNAWCAASVDGVRLMVYLLAGSGAAYHTLQGSPRLAWLLAAGCAAALAGSLLGQALVKKITLRGVRVVVGVALLALGGAIAAGLVESAGR